MVAFVGWEEGHDETDKQKLRNASRSSEEKRRREKAVANEGTDAAGEGTRSKTQGTNFEKANDIIDKDSHF